MTLFILLPSAATKSQWLCGMATEPRGLGSNFAVGSKYETWALCSCCSKQIYFPFQFRIDLRRRIWKKRRKMEWGEMRKCRDTALGWVLPWSRNHCYHKEDCIFVCLEHPQRPIGLFLELWIMCYLLHRATEDQGLTFNCWNAHLNHWSKMKTASSSHQQPQSTSSNPLTLLREEVVHVVREWRILFGLPLPSLITTSQCLWRDVRNPHQKHWDLFRRMGANQLKLVVTLTLRDLQDKGTYVNNMPTTELHHLPVTVHSWNSGLVNSCHENQFSLTLLLLLVTSWSATPSNIVCWASMMALRSLLPTFYINLISLSQYIQISSKKHWKQW